MNNSSRLGPHRRVRVVQRSGRYFVCSLGPLQEFPEFELPPLLLSFVHNLVSISSEFFQSYHRCVAFSLMIDPEIKRWMAVPPTQHCGTNRSEWNYIPDDFLDCGRWLLGGSFQIAESSGLFAAIELVPAHDGIHVVVSPDASAGALSFLRSNDQSMLIHPRSIMIDDLLDLSTRYRDRFNF
jgi:hypothetical protein